VTELAPRRRGPGSRADEHHPTRVELLDSAVAVADRVGLAELSVAGVTAEAGVAKGTFYVHFTDRGALLVALHRRFHDELFARILADTAGRAPGPARLRARLLAFLDGCREMPGVRSLLRDARSEPAVDAEVRRRNAQARRVLAEDLRAPGPTGHEQHTARLLVAATVEAATAELDAGRRLPGLRRALLDLV
jgi:TetR/AcrR family transcriptional regulator, transcriptional repressor for nem operon